MPRIYVVGTGDTKGVELLYIKRLIEARGLGTRLVDVGTQGHFSEADVMPEEVANHHPKGRSAVLGISDRGKAVEGMSEALARYILSLDDIAGIIGIGGTGGTALLSPAFRALPIGTPKILVSTVASGNTAPYVGASDICMMYSVTDIAGINSISGRVLGNAAHAIAGMVAADVPVPDESRPVLGLTMFGVTTPSVQKIVSLLDPAYECLVFHATGTGGRSMEKLADSGMLSGIIDVTTTEVCDLFMGGVFAATEDRFGAVARSRLPYVGSCGALDMVNFGAMETVPERYRGRNFYVHNPQVTLMRTTPEENARMGAWIAARLNACDGPVRFLIPEGGVSALDAPGKPFHDPEADAALFSAIEANFVATASRRLIRLAHHVNDPAFAEALVSHFKEISQSSLRRI